MRRIYFVLSIFLMSVLFCVSFTFGNLKVCQAKQNNKQTLDINQENFFSHFFYNENLLGESGKNYIVRFCEDIDLGFDFVGSMFVNDYPLIGSEDKPFTACIDGNGKTIKNFTVSLADKDSIAFFGFISSKIFDLNFNNCTFSSKNYASVLALNAKDAILENITISECSIYSKETSSFVLNAQNTFCKNVDVCVNNSFLIEGFEFAKSFVGGGVCNTRFEQKGSQTLTSNISLNNWSTEIENLYQQINSRIISILLNYYAQTEGKVNEQKNESNSTFGNSVYFFVLIGYVVICACLCLLYFFRKILTNKRSCDIINTTEII